MKILRVNSLGYEAGGDTNGILLVNDELRKRGHEVRTLASDLGPPEKRFNEYTFPALSRVPMWRRLLYRTFYPASFVMVRRILKEWKPDIVQIHTVSEVSPSVLFALSDTPAVLTVHGAEDFTPGLLLWAFPRSFFKGEGFTKSDLNLRGWLHYWYHTYINGVVYRIGFRFIGACITFSAYMQTLLRSDGIESEMIPNGTRLFAPVPYDKNSRVIAYVGRLEKIKGVEHAIEAFAYVRQTFPDAVLKIAGTGAYESELRELAVARGCADSIVFMGHISRDELYKLYSECAFSLVPSLWPEPFGKVGIEAMSVGRPVIASDVGGIKEWLLDGETGFLVQPGDTKALAQKMLELFSDPQKAIQMADAARKKSQQFSIESHTDRILELYERVIRAKVRKTN